MEAALRIAAVATASQDPDTFGEEVASAVLEEVRCAFVSFADVLVESGTVDTRLAPADVVLPEGMPDAAIRLGHPIVDEYLATGDGSARRLSDVTSVEEYHAHPVYREAYAAIGLEHQLAVTIPCPAWHVMGISLCRTGEDPDFDDAEVELVDAVRPFLVQGYRNAETHARLEELLAGSGDADGVAGALLVEDERVVEAPPALVEAVSRYFEPVGADLPPPVAEWAAARRGGAHELAPPLVAEGPERRLTLRFVPGHRHDVLLVDEHSPDRTAACLHGYGLTPREAQVVLELTRGEANAAIARRLGVSPHTVKKHLERIYRKLGVPGRAGAIALAFEVLARR